MREQLRKRWVRWLCATVFCLACLSPPVHQFTSVPASIEVSLGGQTVVPLRLPHGAKISTSNDAVLRVQSLPVHAGPLEDVAIQPEHVGHALISTRLFGFLPWKSVDVQVVPEHRVVVGGESVGIRLKSHGVMVVGYQRVNRTGASPAAKADVRMGDVIEQINRRQVQSAADVRQLVQHSRGSLELLVRRGDDHRIVHVQPALDEEGQPHLGLYVREKTSGVGTLTYYDPTTRRFGALGHVITDADTGQPIHGTGSLFHSEVLSVVRGLAGKPGEKRGRFIHTEQEIGHIERNTPYGVFGTLSTDVPLATERVMPIALPREVHEGPAKIYTVVHGQTVEAYDVQIENLVRQQRPATKSMIVHVTDERLLRLCGGIVQGMSGSPIVQDGKLVGAVTHVFVSDPSRGYGVYAAWMLSAGDETEHVPEENVQSA
ncbi:SpoIVB peptidase [Alicyclobacillus contaminans]|uniref:SpoIVB peptidase n=1 Tax=Alicyclobacillus contaminans TaxID=392016 RepID=UPI0004187353|nr:SpoIVB peptidase [Alicyclobacillus contaminans]GMA52418.1 SpoIVB peptidase [Alicyclobacillus contaminans]